MQMGRQSSRIHPREGLEAAPRHSRVPETDAVVQGMKGLSAPAIKNKLALRVSLTGSVFMDSVKVSHDALLPKSKGLGSAFSCLNSAR